MLRTLPWLFAIFLTMQALAGSPGVEDDFDRLDGRGKSGKRVDVIEWEGNLEIHVYPKGSLVGLALKLDDKDRSKKVMVIGYRFNNAPDQPLIRRALISVPFYVGFKAYKDPSADDYDKVVISNNGLSGQVVAITLDPEPTQLYPDGHPVLAQQEEEKKAKEREQSPRTPAGNSQKKAVAAATPAKPLAVAPAAVPASTEETNSGPSTSQVPEEDDGRIRAFSW